MLYFMVTKCKVERKVICTLLISVYSENLCDYISEIKNLLV